MPSVKILLSTTADGSMLSREDSGDLSVIENRKKFLKAHAIPVETATRVSVDMLKRATITNDTNYCRYTYVTPELIGDGVTNEESFISDALITDRSSEAIVLPLADCVGAVYFDPSKSILMVSHLGRHSLEQDGAFRSVQYLTEYFNCNPEDLEVWLSPAPNKIVYPIWALNNMGMKEATLEQLHRAGIRDENITDDQRDTIADTDFYSYSEFLKGHRKEDGDHMIVAVIEP